MKEQIDPKIKRCLDDCAKCYQLCVMTIRHCSQMGGVHVMPRHIALLQDCAEICKLSENFILRNSEHAKCVCDECAIICGECADSCEKVDPRDTEMIACAKMCRECATSCKEMP